MSRRSGLSISLLTEFGARGLVPHPPYAGLDVTEP